MKQLIHFFTARHLITNVIFFTVFLVAVFSWHSVNKKIQDEAETQADTKSEK